MASSSDCMLAGAYSGPVPACVSNQVGVLISWKKPSLKVKFTPGEDVKLANLVQQFGTKDWSIIAIHMGTRNARQCRERWKNYVNPKLRTDPWTPEEDRILEEKYKEYGPRWNKIAKYFTNRGDNNIRNRYMMIKRQQTKSKEMPEEKVETDNSKDPTSDAVTQDETDILSGVFDIQLDDWCL